MRRLALAAAVTATTLLSACNDLKDESQTGIFMDSAVAGLEYTRSSQPGQRFVTDADGHFQFVPEETITFWLGDVKLGDSRGGKIVTPLDLVPAANGALTDAVVNRLVLLQTVDSDDDPANGIQISAAMRARFKGKSLDFAGTTLATDLATITAKTPRDAALAREHFESTLARELGRSITTTVGDFGLTKMEVAIDQAFHVPYAGNHTGLKADFPAGFPLSIGSGLAYKRQLADGSREFYVLTDRGPNGDAPDYNNGVTTTKTKAFPAPGFNPKVGIVRVKNGQATLVSTTTILTDTGAALSGRPLASGIGASGETPLTESLDATLGFDANGIDPEGIAIDAGGKLWLCDEYGPYLIQVDPANGRILQKLAPESGLPAVLQYRQPNRGFEGVTVTPAGKVVAAVQSILSLPDVGTKKTSKAAFIRLVEHDPVSHSTRMFAYPHDLASYGKSKDAKLGDLYALSDSKFLIVEQGKQTDGIVHNMIYLVDTGAATDLSGLTSGGLDLEYLTSRSAVEAAGVSYAKKTLILDLQQQVDGRRPFGWLAEKLEGLTMIDDRTLAIINDNDFGLGSAIVGADGTELKGDDCTIDANKAFTGSKCPATTSYSYHIGRGSISERPSRLWLIRLPQAIGSYPLP